MRKLLLCGFAALAPAMPMAAQASCGSAFCTTNTSWDVQGAWQEPGARVDLRYEYIKQDRLMSGTRRIGIGEIPRDHDEIETTNQNWLLSFDYTLDPDWGLTASLPLVSRRHEHLDNDTGTPVPENWSFTQPGDARFVARRRLATFEDESVHSIGTLGATFGLKLPTGHSDLRNPDGELAERSLQPGTDTTDWIAGLYYSKALPQSDLSWFVSGQLQSPIGPYDEFRPGMRLLADAGVRYAASEKVGLMLQLNALLRGRDRGDQAEPEDSGGRSIFLSPGVSYQITPSFQVYGFIQLPVYQYVNGVQLAARRAVAVGVSSRF